MVERDAHADLARRARQAFAEQLAQAGPRILESLLEAARVLLARPAERGQGQQRRDNLAALTINGSDWIRRQGAAFRSAGAALERRETDFDPFGSPSMGKLQLTLVDDATVERDIFASRLGQSILDDAMWEYNDVSARIGSLDGEGIAELAENDLFRPQQVAKIVTHAFFEAGMGPSVWSGLEKALRQEIGSAANEAYHEVNRWLIERSVMPDVNLRQLIRRSLDTRMAALDSRPAGLDEPRGGGVGGPTTTGGVGRASGYGNSGYGAGAAGGNGTGAGSPGGAGAPAPGPGGQSTFAATQPLSGFGGGAGATTRAGFVGTGSGGTGAGTAAGPAPGRGGAGGGYAVNTPTGFSRTTTFVPDTMHATDGQRTRSVRRPLGGSSSRGSQISVTSDAVPMLVRFGETLERYIHGFMSDPRPVLPSPAFVGALAEAQHGFVERVEARRAEGSVLATPEMLEALRTQKQTLKKAAETPAERATIEIVAMLFQSILTEERIPASVRVWFARLQMPTLRVAVSEPDFFSSAEHPARRLIDRMGACVMGFDASPEGVGPVLEAEIARIVQVVEAFPETGRKVFQSVLVEFERFLEKYFRDDNETTRHGVSLATQVEQRETLAIQYTIELRKLLDGVPVQDGVRDFLFQVWADILATVAVRHGRQSAEARAILSTASELVWIGSAKTTREEREDVIRRLGPLLFAIKRGMLSGGLSPERQDAALKQLNAALTSAFDARVAPVDQEQLARLKTRLGTLDEILPDADFELDDSFALDLSGHESDELEVVTEGGSTPSAAALVAAENIQVGAWFMLNYRDRHEQVQLAWVGMRKQLTLFVSSRGRCVLFQKRRLAAFLQAQLLTPAQEETLTMAATRNAIEKINADPARLN